MRRLLAIALAVLGLAACSASPAPPTAMSITVYEVAERRPAPALSGELLDGGAFDPSAYQNKVIVVNFWASWCAPCVIEADDLEQTYQATRAGGVAFVGVNTRDERDKARAFVVGRSSYPSVFDPAGRLALGFAVPPTSIPSTIIIDRQGRVAGAIFGAVRRDNLQSVLETIAAEAL